MSMSNTTKLIISVCLLAAPLACDDGGDPPAAPDAGEDRDALFVADPPRTDEVVLARADAELLAEVDLAGGGRVVFIDEDPGSDTPAIAVVAVEPDDGPSVIDGLVAGRTSPLDLYLSLIHI